MKKQLLFILSICLLLGAGARAQIAPAYAARLQTVLDSMCTRYHVKGASAAIYVPGSGTWTGVYGESCAGVPITDDMLFGLGSNTKTYTAALLLKLQEEGALQLSDTIGRWIQNQPNISGSITIRQLLNHTSGIFNYTRNAAFSDSVSADFGRIWQPEEMLQFVQPPVFAPGQSWQYSNTNYLLAGIIISRVTGMPVEQALRTKLLAPQGLSHTFFYPQERYTGTIPHVWTYNAGRVIDATALGYTHESFFSAGNSAGALLATAGDNVQFWHALSAGQVLNAASMGQWRQTVRVDNNTGYGLGIFRFRNFNGRVVYSHGGTNLGFINENLVDSASGVCISLLTNQDSADNDMLLNYVVKALHKVTLYPPTAVYAASPLPGFTLYPNPARDVLNVQAGNGDALLYRILDAMGRVVAGGVLTPGGSAINVRELPRGSYRLQLHNEAGQSGARPFVLQ